MYARESIPESFLIQGMDVTKKISYGTNLSAEMLYNYVFIYLCQQLQVKWTWELKFFYR